MVNKLIALQLQATMQAHSQTKHKSIVNSRLSLKWLRKTE